MNNYDFLLQFLKDNYKVEHGEFDDFYHVGDYTFMVTCQNNGAYWKNCTSDFGEWSRKKILLFKGKDCDPVIELANKLIIESNLAD